jgi:hypothetical protein
MFSLLIVRYYMQISCTKGEAKKLFSLVVISQRTLFPETRCSTNNTGKWNMITFKPAFGDVLHLNDMP